MDPSRGALLKRYEIEGCGSARPFTGIISGGINRTEAVDLKRISQQRVQGRGKG